MGIKVNKGCFEPNMALIFALKGDGLDGSCGKGNEGFEVEL